MTTFTIRPYRDENDYWRIRAFLREVLTINDYRQRSWDLPRFDYWRWHGVQNIVQKPLQELLILWETAGGQTAAVLNAEAPGEVFFQRHPGFDSPDLAAEMLSAAETHLWFTGQGSWALTVWANEHDAPLLAALQNLGYTKGKGPEYQRRQSLSACPAFVPPPPGYIIRALGGPDELPARSWLSWRAFHPDEPVEHYQGWEWYRNIQRAPLYRRDLDLVAVASDGQLAAFCTVWFDDCTRTGIFEPVGTEPAHQRRGLGRALLAEGLRRLHQLGAAWAYVGSYSQAAGALYAAAGFTDFELSYPWLKSW